MIEAQNSADQIAYAAEKALKEHGEKVPEDIRKNVQEKIDALKTARNGSEAAGITSAAESLSAAMSTIGEAMQKSQTPPEAPPEEGKKE